MLDEIEQINEMNELVLYFFSGDYRELETAQVLPLHVIQE
jgi:hypothetical protein